MKKNQCNSTKLMWLPVAAAPKHFCGNVCLPAVVPPPGARLHAEADAPSQRECRRSWRSGRIGRGGLSSTAFTTAYCHAQQHLSTSSTVSAGTKQYLITYFCLLLPSLISKKQQGIFRVIKKTQIQMVTVIILKVRYQRRILKTGSCTEAMMRQCSLLTET